MSDDPYVGLDRDKVFLEMEEENEAKRARGEGSYESKVVKRLLRGLGMTTVQIAAEILRLGEDKLTLEWFNRILEFPISLTCLKTTFSDVDSLLRCANPRCTSWASIWDVVESFGENTAGVIFQHPARDVILHNWSSALEQMARVSPMVGKSPLAWMVCRYHEGRMFILQPLDDFVLLLRPAAEE